LNSPKEHHREGCLATVQIKPVKFTRLRCTSAELFFSCCGSVAAQLVTILYHNAVFNLFSAAQLPTCLSHATELFPFEVGIGNTIEVRRATPVCLTWIWVSEKKHEVIYLFGASRKNKKKHLKDKTAQRTMNNPKKRVFDNREKTGFWY
jgi:hypothetical protein